MGAYNTNVVFFSISEKKFNLGPEMCDVKMGSNGVKKRKAGSQRFELLSYSLLMFFMYTVSGLSSAL